MDVILPTSNLEKLDIVVRPWLVLLVEVNTKNGAVKKADVKRTMAEDNTRDLHSQPVMLVPKQRFSGYFDPKNREATNYFWGDKPSTVTRRMVL